jgi:hypothetical protein
MGGDAAPTFDEASIIALARAKADLQDFGDESFRSPLRVLLHSLETEADLNAAGRAAQHARIVDSLVVRLRAEDYFRRHPEILDERIQAPVVIMGLARTGTTLLQRLLASDPFFQAVLWWECRNPAPFPGSDWTAHDPRIDDARVQVRMILEAVPQLAAIHPWDPEGPDEEILLLEHAFLSHVPESGANLPSYRAWLTDQDFTPGYEYVARMLRFLQWQKKRAGRSGEAWILKSPCHLGYLDVLFRVFPDVRVIQTHRDPLETIPSVASLYSALWELATDDVDRTLVGRQCQERYAWAINRSLRIRDALPPERFHDIWFRDVVREPMEQVRRIYAWLGRELSPAAERAMLRFLSENARDKRAPHEYAMETFGYSAQGLARDFARYRERFIMGREGGPVYSTS